MTGMESLPVVLKALEFAAGRHRHQFRKGEDKAPYINHPIQVASLLVNSGGETDPVLIAAAILHDVIEDTVDSTGERDELIHLIRQEFGDEILSVTLEVTDDKTLDKQERKRLQVLHAPAISLHAKKLKLADKIWNVRDITSNPPVGWSKERIIEYFDWAGKVVEGLRGANPRLEKLFDEAITAGRKRYLQP